MDAAIVKNYVTHLEIANLESVLAATLQPVVEVALAMDPEAARVTGTVDMSARAMEAAR